MNASKVSLFTLSAIGHKNTDSDKRIKCCISKPIISQADNQAFYSKRCASHASICIGSHMKLYLMFDQGTQFYHWLPGFTMDIFNYGESRINEVIESVSENNAAIILYTSH